MKISEYFDEYMVLKEAGALSPLACPALQSSQILLRGRGKEAEIQTPAFMAERRVGNANTA